MTQTTPGWHTPGRRLTRTRRATPSLDRTDTAALPTTVDAQEFVAPTPPPPPPPTWYGETAPLPTTPPLATQPAGPPSTPPSSPFGAPSQPTGGSPRRPRRWVDIVVAAVVAAAVAGATAGLVVHNNDSSNGSSASSNSSSASSSPDAPAPVQQGNGNAPDWTVTAAAVEPSVVAITVGSQQSGQEAQGSGIILDKTGHVLTNNHVATAVDGGPITVTLTDQRTYKATIVGTDPTTDLAVLKITSPPSRPQAGLAR